MREPRNEGLSSRIQVWSWNTILESACQDESVNKHFCLGQLKCLIRENNQGKLGPLLHTEKATPHL